MPSSKQQSGGRKVSPRSSLFFRIRFVRLRMDGVLVIAALAAVCLLLPGQARAHGGFHEEVVRIDALLLEAPTDAGLWQQRGWLYLFHGDWQQALLDAEKAERLAPGRLPSAYLMGKALAAGGKLDAARVVLDDYLKLNPEHADAWLERSRVLLRLSLFDESVSDLRTALAKTPEPEPDLYVELAQALAGRSQPDAAVQVLEQGILKMGNTPSFVLKIVQIEAVSGKLDRALARLEAMQRTGVRPEPWMAERARLFAQAGRILEARAAWTELRDRIQGMPDLERGSHAMSVLAEQADKALNSFIPTTSAMTFK